MPVYPVIRAARYGGVPAWELMKQPALWRDWLLMAEGAETKAERLAHERAEQDRKLKQFGSASRSRLKGFAKRR